MANTYCKQDFIDIILGHPIPLCYRCITTNA